MWKWILSIAFSLSFYLQADDNTDVRLLLSAFVFSIVLNAGRISELKSKIESE